VDEVGVGLGLGGLGGALVADALGVVGEHGGGLGGGALGDLGGFGVVAEFGEGGGLGEGEFVGVQVLRGGGVAGGGGGGVGAGAVSWVCRGARAVGSWPAVRAGSASARLRRVRWAIWAGETPSRLACSEAATRSLAVMVARWSFSASWARMRSASAASASAA